MFWMLFVGNSKMFWVFFVEKGKILHRLDFHPSSVKGWSQRKESVTTAWRAGGLGRTTESGNRPVFNRIRTDYSSFI